MKREPVPFIYSQEETMSRRATLAVITLVLFTTTAPAQEKADEADLAATIQNPLASLVSLPMQANYNLGVGEYDRTMFNLNVQPVIPYHPNEEWNVITRAIIPLNSVPEGETDSVFGIGDTSLSLFLSPNNTSALTWGVGPAFTLPSASNPEALGSGKLSLGPTGVVFYGIGKWTMGAVASNVWSVAGQSDREDVNFFFAQWFLNFNIGHGWAVGTAPIITGNWESDPGNRWVIPWGVQISKVTHFGGQPVNILIGYYVNSEHPEGGADKQVRFQLNLLYPQ
jgi:hypothetical protein